MERRYIKQKVLFYIVTLFYFTPVQAVDGDAAQTLARRNNCFRCHGADKERDAAPYKVIAEKYRNDVQAEAKLIHHITSGALVVFPDGHEEEHKIVRTIPGNDVTQIKNLVQWMLSH